MLTQIRKMQMSDIDAVYSIELHTHIAPWTRQIIHDCLLVGYDCRVIELKKNQLAGYVISRLFQHSCHILNICIVTNMQLKGLGSLLLDTVIHTLRKENHISSIYLEVRPSNKVAIHLYTKMGFKLVDIKKNYYHDLNQYEDAMILEKSF